MIIDKMKDVQIYIFLVLNDAMRAIWICCPGGHLVCWSLVTWPCQKVKVLVAQSCLTLCDPMNCSPPGSSVHGILQARIRRGLPFPFPGDLPNPGIELGPAALKQILNCLSHLCQDLRDARSCQASSCQDWWQTGEILLGVSEICVSWKLDGPA